MRHAGKGWRSVSSTNPRTRGGGGLDRFYTDDRTASACVGTLNLADVSRVIEPSVGRGAFVRAIREAKSGLCITGVDIDSSAEGFALCDEAMVKDWVTYRPDVAPDLVLSNFPFGQAEAHLAHALAVVRYGGVVATLLRLAFLASAKRAPFWRTAPLREMFVLSERPSFTSDGRTDSADYAFYLFARGYQGPATVRWIGGAETGEGER